MLRRVRMGQVARASFLQANCPSDVDHLSHPRGLLIDAQNSLARLCPRLVIRRQAKPLPRSNTNGRELLHVFAPLELLAAAVCLSHITRNGQGSRTAVDARQLWQYNGI